MTALATVLSAVGAGTDVLDAVMPLILAATKRDPEAVRARLELARERMRANLADRLGADLERELAQLGRVLERLRRNPDSIRLRLRAVACVEHLRALGLPESRMPVVPDGA